MSLAFKLFWGITALELSMLMLPSIRWQRFLAPFVSIMLSAVTGILFMSHPSVPMLLLSLMNGYRIVNLFRLMRARMHEKYLRRSTRQASLWIVLAQAFVMLVWEWTIWSRVSTYHLWLVLAIVDGLCAVILLSSTIRHLYKTRAPKNISSEITQHSLPTLTVAIPARNETDDLESCLTSLIASDYPKLEILVLDDCSQNRRTPEIIRSFAHSGVRFVQGHIAEDNWLAKNQAYQQLLDEANGDLMLFCGVDVRFDRGSLRMLVTAMLEKKKNMISVIPKNTMRAAGFPFGATLLQPMRYAWELALPRKLFRRPPVLSTCWIARRDMLSAAGGFAAVSRSIVPESYFARVSTVQDGYSFMQSDATMGIQSAKSFSEQQSTVVRTRYPQVHRRVELVMFLTIAELIGVLLPYTLLIMGLMGWVSLQITLISAATIIILTGTYAAIVWLTYRRNLFRALWMPPFAVFTDVLLLNYSMLSYEFFDVIWKGRNVCIPVMYSVTNASDKPNL